MGTLPFTLPGCGQPATVRIEVYSPADGRLHGSLDAVVYTCDRHGIEAVSAIQTAGLTAHRYAAPGVEINRACGYVHVFPTGTVGDPEQPEHPAWCDQQGCDGRSAHRSPAMNVDTNRAEAVILDVALVQGLHPLAEPTVSMTVIEGQAAQHVALSIGQARVLRYRLGNLIDAAKGGRR